jgi:ankyrin repeat protein
MVVFILSQETIDSKSVANVQNTEGETALHIAAKQNNSRMANLLLGFHCDPATKRKPDGVTAWHIAAENGFSGFLKDIAHKKPYDTADTKRMAALLDPPSYTVAKALWEGNMNHDTSLHLAARNGDIEVIQCIVTVVSEWLDLDGSWVAALNKQGKPPMQIAVEACQWDTVWYFLSKDSLTEDLVLEDVGDLYRRALNQMIRGGSGLEMVNEVLC